MHPRLDPFPLPPLPIVFSHHGNKLLELTNVAASSDKLRTPPRETTHPPVTLSPWMPDFIRAFFSLVQGLFPSFFPLFSIQAPIPAHLQSQKGKSYADQSIIMSLPKYE